MSLLSGYLNICLFWVATWIYVSFEWLPEYMSLLSGYTSFWVDTCLFWTAQGRSMWRTATGLYMYPFPSERIPLFSKSTSILSKNTATLCECRSLMTYAARHYENLLQIRLFLSACGSLWSAYGSWGNMHPPFLSEYTSLFSAYRSLMTYAAHHHQELLQSHHFVSKYMSLLSGYLDICLFWVAIPLFEVDTCLFWLFSVKIGVIWHRRHTTIKTSCRSILFWAKMGLSFFSENTSLLNDYTSLLST